MKMPWTSAHIKWLVNTGKRISTFEGKVVEVWEFRHLPDNKTLSAWARHFRNHYCLDDEIDYWRKGIGCSRADYLNDIKFPDKSAAPGPSIRAGDFSEVLVADFLEYVLGFWVPRTRYGDKTSRNESTRGCDIIGFLSTSDEEFSEDDTLAVYEAKAQFSGTKPKNRLQDAVNGSKIDYTRKAESLNAIKQRLFRSGKLDDALKIERFQNEVDHPYKEVNGAVAVFESPLFDPDLAEETETAGHPNEANIVLIVFKGKDMMTLVHDLYTRAANEA